MRDFISCVRDIFGVCFIGRSEGDFAVIYLSGFIRCVCIGCRIPEIHHLCRQAVFQRFIIRQVFIIQIGSIPGIKTARCFKRITVARKLAIINIFIGKPDDMVIVHIQNLQARAHTAGNFHKARNGIQYAEFALEVCSEIDNRVYFIVIRMKFHRIIHVFLRFVCFGIITRFDFSVKPSRVKLETILIRHKGHHSVKQVFIIRLFKLSERELNQSRIRRERLNQFIFPVFRLEIRENGIEAVSHRRFIFYRFEIASYQIIAVLKRHARINIRSLESDQPCDSEFDGIGCGRAVSFLIGKTFRIPVGRFDIEIYGF